MRAAVFGDEGGIGVVEREGSEPPPGWVQLAVTSVGICGSDLNLLYAKGAASGGVQPGHEVAGVIDRVGDGVALGTGIQVALEPLSGCGACRYCGAGLPNLCRASQLIGFTRPGGMAEFVHAPADCLYPLDASVPPHVAALTEPVAVCVRGVRLGRIGLNERVVILGAGSIGLLCVLAARVAGAGEVLITARHPHQQALARHLGADGVFASSQALLDAVGSSHADAVLETVGGEADTLTDAVRVARPGGRIVMLGVFEGDRPLPAYRFMQKELTLAASTCYGRECHEPDFAAASALVARHRALIEPLVTHRFKLDQVAEAFATAADKKTQSIKVQVQP